MTDTVKFVEVEPVEAVVLEPEHVELVPAVINAETYLLTRREWLDRMLEPYKGMDDAAIAVMDAKEAKACRADLNRIIKEVESERKAIKVAYEKPLAKFESEVAKLLEPAREAERMLKVYIDDQEQIRKRVKADHLQGVYEDFAPALVPVVPFEAILAKNPKWLNKTVTYDKAEKELCEAVQAIAYDWDVLKSMEPSMAFYQEAEAVFFRTLSLHDAVEHERMRTEEQARIDALKAEQAEIRAEQEAAAQMPAPTEERPAEPSTAPQRRHHVFAAWLSDAEVAMLRNWKNANNVGFGWTFKED